MKKITACILTVFLLTGCAHVKNFDFKKLAPHPEPWTEGQKFMLMVSGAAALADWYTTEKARERGYAEMNPIIGKYPSKADIRIRGWAGYGCIVLLAHFYPELRYLILGTQALTCAGFAAHNSTLE